MEEIIKELKAIAGKLDKLIELNTPSPEINDDEEYTGDYTKCRRCKSEFESYPYAFNGSDLCSDCVEEEIKEAETIKERIKKELKTDTEWKNLKSQSLKQTYILEKYKKESKENSKLFLGSFSRELINLQRLNKL